MRLIRAVIVMVMLSGPLFALAQDTVSVMSPVDSVVVHTDTMRWDNCAEIVTEDMLLLQMVAAQGRDIFVHDSLKRDSLLADLYLRDSLLKAELAVIKDSIFLLRKDELVRQAYEDSLVRVAQQSDSISSIMTDIGDVKGLKSVIPPALIKDPEADLEELAYYFRNSLSPWKKEAKVNIHFTQNYISGNWYKGGISNFSIISLAKGSINYNKDNLSWENTGEWRLGVATTPNDTLRKHNITDDLFRLYSKVGYQVINKLYISSSAEFQTTLWSAWNENAQTVKTAFLTPIRYNMTLGVDYKPMRNMSILISPLAYKMIYSFYGDDSGKVNVNNYGIEAGKHIINELGSSLRFHWKYKPVREVSLETELYFYTNYKRVEFDWEIDCDFIINRFMSVRLELHPRYDNTVIMAGDERAKIQFKELLSFGFAHKFR